MCQPAARSSMQMLFMRSRARRRRRRRRTGAEGQTCLPSTAPAAACREHDQNSMFFDVSMRQVELDHDVRRCWSIENLSLIGRLGGIMSSGMQQHGVRGWEV